MTKNNRRNWRSEDATAKALLRLQEYPDASGSDIAQHLGVSETQGKLYRRLALQQFTLGSTQHPQEVNQPVS